MTWSSQSECFNLAQRSGSTLKFVSGIGSLSISFQLRPTKERFLLKKSSNQSIDRSIETLIYDLQNEKKLSDESQPQFFPSAKVQCDQIASLCFQFGPFTTMKLCPIPYIILPKNVQNVAKTK